MSETSIVVCPHCHAPNRVPVEKLGAAGTCGKCKQPLFVGAPVELDAGSFEKHISRSDIPVLVEAVWKRNR